MTVAKRKSSTDDKIEAKRKIIRRSLHEITAELETELRKANLRADINMVVPSRYTLVTIASACNLPPDEWSRMSAIVRRVVRNRLGANELRGRPLAGAVARAATDAPDATSGSWLVADLPSF